MKKIVLFASGSGSNAENIINYFKDSGEVEVTMILTNNPSAGVIERGKRLDIPVVVFSKKNFGQSDTVIRLLKNAETDWVILAGFLWLVPESLIRAFPDRIINIHPALLPKYGGKGMWGHHVHEAVVRNRENESGITIHYVNEHYDEGKIIFQAICPLSASDTPEDVAQKVHALEYRYFPEIIEGEIRRNK
ncbi:MAG: phosphoribosylglycinamide formyltransferase [Leadbetterella sp.]|nr:phosphoribosylglycinamide formyltransferase [Leadbetterella sp.]